MGKDCSLDIQSTLDRTLANERDIQVLTQAVEAYIIASREENLELKKSIKELANLVREEDKELKHAVAKLLEAQAECKYRWESVNNRLSAKKEVLEEVKIRVAEKVDKEAYREIKAKMSTKASKEEFRSLKAFINKALWWLFGGMVASLGFLIKLTLFTK
jgi:hypothetical protein